MKSFTIAFLSFFLLNPIAIGFSDTEQPSVIRLLEANIFPDEEYFHPNESCKRSDFVVWALKNIGEDVSGGHFLEPFADVVPSQNFSPFVGKAWQMGIVETKKLFWPSRGIQKIDALSMALQLEGINIPRGGFSLEYKDLPKESFQQGVIAKALEMGITRDETKTTFGTKKQLSRLECAQILDAVRLSRSSEHPLHIQIKTKKSESDIPHGDVLSEVLQALTTQYLRAETLNEDGLMESAIREMVNTVGDPYTVYYNEEEVRQFLTSVGESNEFGIGAQVDLNKENQLEIIKPLRNSPAEKAGLQPGDIVLRVNDVDVTGMLLEESVKLIKGEDGTDVFLTILRGKREKKITVTRGTITPESIFAKPYGEYLLIEMSFFGKDTVSKFQQVIEQYPKLAEQGILLDLRNNPGGFLDTAINLLALLLPPDSVAVKTKGRDIFHTETVRGPGTYSSFPLIILVNERSASASEIVAGAIQDHKRGSIVGNTTFGKGTAQNLLQFSDGSALKMTIAEWLTPNDRSIQGIGITPDFPFIEKGSDTAILDFASRLIRRNQWKPSEKE